MSAGGALAARARRHGAAASAPASPAVLAATLLLAAIAVGPDEALADDADAPCAADALALEHAFASGASWSFCARLDPRHGLELGALAYRAPGDRARPVLRSLHLAEVLVHRHDRPRAGALVGDATAESSTLGAAATRPLGADDCAGERLALGAAAAPLLCLVERDAGLLAKYADRAAVHGARLEIHAVAARGALVWRVAVALGEDGRIAPSLALGGRLVPSVADARYATPIDDGRLALPRATLRATWRLAFALDGEAPDRVEELDYPLDGVLGTRRAGRTRTLDTESLRRVAPERFRVWRVADRASGAGYLVESVAGGQDWLDRRHNWTRFELALTRPRDCERHALGNRAERCGEGLDDFVDGESLADTSPVLWLGRSRLWRPRREDLPLLTALVLGVSLLPFDWTARSPFGDGS